MLGNKWSGRVQVEWKSASGVQEECKEEEEDQRNWWRATAFRPPHTFPCSNIIHKGNMYYLYSYCPCSWDNPSEDKVWGSVDSHKHMWAASLLVRVQFHVDKDQHLIKHIGPFPINSTQSSFLRHKYCPTPIYKPISGRLLTNVTPGTSHTGEIMPHTSLRLPSFGPHPPTLPYVLSYIVRTTGLRHSYCASWVLCG